MISVSYNYLLSFFKAFLWTVLIESLVFCFLTRINLLKALVVVLLVDCFSLPIVWFLIPFIANSDFSYVFMAELFAVLSEAALLRFLLQFSYKRAMAVSVAINMVSFLVGLIFPFLIAQ